ncbi:MAG: DUF4258 domain-containing protein [bacterium]|nr:DUF4258 domain-containing protein [bacterium]
MIFVATLGSFRKQRRHLPKNDARYLWTNHAIRKMAFYRLSQGRIRRVLRNPARIEEGVAPGTVAAMQTDGSGAKSREIWVMYQEVGKKRRIITAWRYPGKSPIRKKIPIPQDIVEELEREGIIGE